MREQWCDTPAVHTKFRYLQKKKIFVAYGLSKIQYQIQNGGREVKKKKLERKNSHFKSLQVHKNWSKKYNQKTLIVMISHRKLNLT